MVKLDIVSSSIANMHFDTLLDRKIQIRWRIEYVDLLKVCFHEFESNSIPDNLENLSHLIQSLSIAFLIVIKRNKMNTTAR